MSETERGPGDAGQTITAPSEGAASTYRAIADELCTALEAFERVDYNALTEDELREVLDARETIEDICLRHRRQQQSHRDHEGEP